MENNNVGEKHIMMWFEEDLGRLSVQCRWHQLNKIAGSIIEHNTLESIHPLSDIVRVKSMLSAYSASASPFSSFSCYATKKHGELSAPDFGKLSAPDFIHVGISSGLREGDERKNCWFQCHMGFSTCQLQSYGYCPIVFTQIYSDNNHIRTYVETLELNA